MLDQEEGKVLDSTKEDIVIVSSGVEDDNARIDSNPMLEIRLDWKDVKCGSKLTGCVMLLPKKSSLEELTLKIRGTSLINMKTDGGKKYSSKEIHLYEKTVLYSKKRDGDIQKRELLTSDTTPLSSSQGQETAFQFEFLIPPDCPPTYDGRYVQIFYELVAFAKFSDILRRKQTAQMSFIVSAANILVAKDGENIEESVDVQNVQPTKVYKEFTISLLEKQKPHIKMNIEVNRSIVDRSSSDNADIQFDMSVVNNSKVTVVSLKYGLMQIIRSSIKGRQTVEKIILREYENNDFQLFPNKKWICKRKFDFSAGNQEKNCERNLPSSFSFKSSVFSCDVSYFIFAILIPPNFGRICELYLPLKIL